LRQPGRVVRLHQQTSGGKCLFLNGAFMSDNFEWPVGSGRHYGKAAPHRLADDKAKWLLYRRQAEQIGRGECLIERFLPPVKNDIAKTYSHCHGVKLGS